MNQELEELVLEYLMGERIEGFLVTNAGLKEKALSIAKET